MPTTKEPTTPPTNGKQEQAPAPPKDSYFDDAPRPIPLTAIRPSKLNPRKTFDEAKLQELATSIRAKGVLQPILVRPLLSDVATCKTEQRVAESFGIAGSTRYELVAGERRFRAAKLAGLTSIPAIVRQLTDREVLEIAVIENAQREDVSALEKADAYGQLVDRHQVKVEDLAKRTGEGLSTIRGLLRLRALPERARKAVESGALNASVAQLLARVPGEKARNAAIAAALRPNYTGELPSYRAMKDFLERECMVELKGAPFPRVALDLVPAAGSCDACPKRTGNNREEYPDARADVCTDPECYRAKVEAWKDKVSAEEKAAGRKVLAPAECEKLFGRYSGDLAYDAPYVDLAAQCYEDPKRRSYKQLVGEQLKAEVVVGFDAGGNKHALVPKDKALTLLRERGIGKGQRSLSSNKYDADFKRRQREEERKQREGRAAALAANGKIAELAEQLFAGLAGLKPAAVAKVRALVVMLADVTWSNACERVAKRRGLERKGQREPVKRLAESMTGAPELLGLAVELVAARASDSWGHPYMGGGPEGNALWKAWGIDKAALMRAAAADKAESNGKVKAKLKVVKGGAR